MNKRIFRSILSVSAAVLAAAMILVLGVLHQFVGDQLSRELKREAAYLAPSVESMGAEYLEGLSLSDARITLIDAEGQVLFDNHSNPQSMENHQQRQEIQSAQKWGEGWATRRSETLGQDSIYYAKKLSDGQILRVSTPLYSSTALVLSMLPPLLLVVGLALILSTLFASHLSARIVAPINSLDLDQPENSNCYDELAPLLSRIRQQNRTIRNQLQEARRQQEEFAVITQNMDEGLLVIDKESCLLSSNPSALQLLGAQLLPGRQSVLTLDRSAPFQQAVETALQGEHAVVLLERGERTLQLLANPVSWEDGIQGAVLILLDITERTQRDQLRREFTANVSHELKTPLTSISGFAELMKNGMVQGDGVNWAAERIYEEAHHLIRLVEDIIRISQLDEGGLPYELQDVELHQLGQEILSRLEHAAQAQHLTLAIQGEEATVHVPRPILEEVVFNLCDNAVKYNRPDGMVTVTTGIQEGQPFLQVADTGIGIAPAEQARVFERFYRVDKSHSKEIGGTGLGLSIVKHGAACMGAQVKLESTPGQGSVFTLTWPKA